MRYLAIAIILFAVSVVHRRRAIFSPPQPTFGEPSIRGLTQAQRQCGNAIDLATPGASAACAFVFRRRCVSLWNNGACRIRRRENGKLLESLGF